MTQDHRRDLRDHQIEHAASELWEGAQELEQLRATTGISGLEPVVEQLVQRGLARREGSRLALTEPGRQLAEGVTRRHRLAELLFSTVFDVRDDGTVHRTACVMEHVLSPEVTDSVCSFLGHPKLCPHGKPIPPGGCCRSFSSRVEPLVQPLHQLGVGQSGRIAYIVPKDPERLVRLSDLGILPGVTVRLRQKSPAAVISVGETSLALDAEIAEEIYVKKVS